MTLPALSDLEAIADYIAIENPAAAAEVVQRLLKHVGQIVESPCRVIYRCDKRTAYVLHVDRAERLLSAALTGAGLTREMPMLELRPTCENCNKPLPPDSAEARICSYECTFCTPCGRQATGRTATSWARTRPARG